MCIVVARGVFKRGHGARAFPPPIHRILFFFLLLLKVLASLASLYAPSTLIFTFCLCPLHKTFLNTPHGHGGYILHITNKVIRQLIYGSIAGKNETYILIEQTHYIDEKPNDLYLKHIN